MKKAHLLFIALLLFVSCAENKDCTEQVFGDSNWKVDSTVTSGGTLTGGPVIHFDSETLTAQNLTDSNAVYYTFFSECDSIVLDAQRCGVHANGDFVQLHSTNGAVTYFSRVQ